MMKQGMGKSEFELLEYGDYLAPLNESDQVYRVLERRDRGVWVAPQLRHMPGPELLKEVYVLARYERVPYAEAQRYRLTKVAITGSGMIAGLGALVAGVVNNHLFTIILGTVAVIYFGVHVLAHGTGWQGARQAKATKAWFTPTPKPH